MSSSSWSLSGPVHSEYGYHVLQVTKRGLATFDDVRDDIKAEIGPQPFQSLAIWRQVHLARAAVTVDPRFTKGVTLTPNTDAGSGGASASSTSDGTAGAGTPTTVGPVPSPTTTTG